MSCLFIDDGYSLPGKLPERKGLHPGLNFVYRPALPLEVQRYVTALGGSAEEAQRSRVALVARHLVSWDAKGADGAALPVGEDVLKRMRYQVLVMLADIIAGYAFVSGGESESGSSAPN